LAIARLWWMTLMATSSSSRRPRKTRPKEPTPTSVPSWIDPAWSRVSVPVSSSGSASEADFLPRAPLARGALPLLPGACGEAAPLSDDARALSARLAPPPGRPPRSTSQGFAGPKLSLLSSSLAPAPRAPRAAAARRRRRATSSAAAAAAPAAPAATPAATPALAPGEDSGGGGGGGAS
jgi:hypothetical protein